MCASRGARWRGAWLGEFVVRGVVGTRTEVSRRVVNFAVFLSRCSRIALGTSGGGAGDSDTEHRNYISSQDMHFLVY